MKLIAIASAILVASFSFASAGQWGQGNNTDVRVRNNVSSQSYSQSRSNSRATGGDASNSGISNNTNFRDRLQAPGFGVGGGYCANGLSISFPGGGFGFTAMERMCRTEIGARVAKQYLNPQAAAQYVCSQADFRNLTVCRPAARRTR